MHFESSSKPHTLGVGVGAETWGDKHLGVLLWIINITHRNTLTKNA